jgi:ATP-dependent RNA helicase DeaD
MLFSEMNLLPEIFRAVEEVGYTEATEIQAGTIPLILEGKDLIGRSNTGTGKTAAFGIPIVQMVARRGRERGQVLILSPTRELAMQTGEEVRRFSKYLQNVKAAVVCGGESMPPQIRQLRTAQIIIGTPGRIMDHMRRRTLSLENLKTVVLDEADEMLNMGFLEDIQTILKEAPEGRQTVLFSATMPPAIMKVTKEFQTAPRLVATDKGQKTVDNISQFYYSVPRDDKTSALKLLLEYHRPRRALVFCNTKKTVDQLCEQLNGDGFQAAGLHGDLKQNQRNQVMNDFKNGRVGILVATDVAARGIDVDDVDAVFNYDIPDEDEYYIHRIGRTGRAGKAGTSYTLAASRGQMQRVHSLERFMDLKIQEAPVPNVEDIQARRLKKFKRSVEELAGENRLPEWTAFVEGLEQDGCEPKSIAAALCKILFDKNKRLGTLKNVRKVEPASSGNGKARLQIDIGSDSRINADFIIGTIVETTGLPVGAVGKIEISGDRSTVEMNPADAELVLKKMNGYRMKRRTVHVTIAKTRRYAYHANGRNQARPFYEKRRSSGKKRYYGPVSGQKHRSGGRNP